MTVGIDFAVFDREDAFGELCRHAEKRRQPHPEHGARSARDDRRRHSHDIARAYRRREGGAERAEAGNFALAAAFLGEHIAERARQADERQKDQPHGEIYPHAQNEYDEGDAPDKFVYIGYYLSEFFHMPLRDR